MSEEDIGYKNPGLVMKSGIFCGGQICVISHILSGCP